jgi:hypothetical protein
MVSPCPLPAFYPGRDTASLFGADNPSNIRGTRAPLGGIRRYAFVCHE